MAEILDRPRDPSLPVTSSEWVLCCRCRALTYGKRFVRDLCVCPECGWHARLTAQQRLEQLLDPRSAEQLAPAFDVDTAPPVYDPLGFVDTRPYPERLREARAVTGLDEAVVCARGTIGGHPVIAAVMDFRFLGGSLGCGVGELITQAAETALREEAPLLLVTASGGARMQEGALSLMQMAKTSQALAQLDEAGVLVVSLITDPTYGGVAASFATLADVILAEPGARLGFAGPRVIEQTVRQKLPDGFQTAEFLFQRGFLDDVQPRAALRTTLARLLAVARPRLSQAVPRPAADPVIRRPHDLPPREPWEVVQLARHLDRPTTLDYIDYLVDGFHELHGDRVSGDCSALVGGPGWLHGVPVMVIGHQKGHTLQDRASRNFGMANPEGYRKAARLMRLAAKLRLPVITLIDTPGAYPGIAAEEHGQAIAIAENLRLMSQLPVPIIAVITGEGGSGGALALGVADRVLISANAMYSVISPEGCAAILWRCPEAAPQAAAALRLDARELLRLGVVDGVVPEPDGGAHHDPALAAAMLGDALAATLHELLPIDGAHLVRERRRRFRSFGADLRLGLEEVRP
ncbi:Acetyl-coenzyme A carboxyl transferase alpha chain [Carbonactinospora thermoautotrophica]|uniref:Multifunctional fusion protein n=1 Tax=Carbonactinospora thermoautotrophica TaxID=1469144 RepID=A0A132MYQ6_9ACTN|nr:acetyl-CoA carboxylase carboxyltransferase subunit alpha [Carbonactinospora thermoautotrophica]KWX02964.1 Acetyl-coenzyme A carboxyl transferase alpha chain [Carbonactinospora thermoautotrophica]